MLSTSDYRVVCDQHRTGMNLGRGMVLEFLQLALEVVRSTQRQDSLNCAIGSTCLAARDITDGKDWE